MENRVNPYTHSFIAGKILKKLICAKLAHTPNSTKLFLSKDETSIHEGVPENQPALYGSDLVFNVVSKKEIVKGVYRVKFSNEKTKVKIFNPGLEMLGRHYLVSSLQNKVLRYYTICNCLNSSVYDKYIHIFDCIIKSEDNKRGFSQEKDTSIKSEIDKIEVPEYADNLELVIKFYPQSKRGITKQLLDATKDDQFFITGPVSKGFDLNEKSIVGTTLIFVGGTGVIPYVDLFAYLARRLIKEKMGQNTPFPEEQYENYMQGAKFIVYAYYPRPSEAVSLEF